MRPLPRGGWFCRCRAGSSGAHTQRAVAMNRSAPCGPQIVNLKFIILHNLQLSDSNVHSALCAEHRMQFHLLSGTGSDANSDSRLLTLTLTLTLNPIQSPIPPSSSPLPHPPHFDRISHSHVLRSDFILCVSSFPRP